MDFFEIKNPLRRIGQDKYIIGQQPLDPLVLIEGKKIETNEISVSILNFDEGFFDNTSGENIDSLNISTQSGFIDNLVLKTGFFEDISGELLNSITGNFDSSEIKDLTLETGQFNFLSGQNFNSESGNISYAFIGDLNINTGSAESFLVDQINVAEFLRDVSGNLIKSGAYLYDLITGIQVSGVGGGGISSGFEEEMLRSRFLQKEAFELNEFGEVTPTTHEFISDTMWILREDNNLELRANLWRYDTGPNAFTDDISF